MKIIIGTLLLCTLALCEPPYPPRGFRPSQNYRLYRPPSVDLKLNSKLTIEQLIGLTEKLQRSKTRPQSNYGPPSTSYGVPDVKQVETFDFLRQQLPYRAPTGFNSQQSSFGYQNSFGGGGINNQNQPQQRYVPQNSLGVSQYAPQQTQSSFGVSSSNPNQPQQFQNSFGGGRNNQNLPQNSLGVNQYAPQQPQSSPNQPQQSQNSLGGGRHNQNQPQQQYNVPQKSSGASQYVPQQSSNSQYQPQQSQNSFGEGINDQNQPQQRYTPQNSLGVSQQPQNTFGAGANNQNSLGVSQQAANDQPQQPQSSNGGGSQYLPPQSGGYLPPQTTPRSVEATTLPPSTTAASVEANDYDYDQQQATEEGPNNVSVSNAVAGAGGFFYLQQPDGRLQKVVLQKTQEPNSKPEEYVANYYFQNVQALPDVAYAPLINLAGFTQK